MKKESNHQQQFPTFCILPVLQSQFSSTGIFFQDSLYIVGSMLYSLVKEAKINSMRKHWPKALDSELFHCYFNNLGKIPVPFASKFPHLGSEENNPDFVHFKFLWL